MGSEKYRKQKKEIMPDLKDISDRLEMGANESHRVAEVVHNTREILDDLDAQFCEATGLTKVDMLFLFSAIGLQIARQYLLTSFPQRLDDKSAADKISGHNQGSSDRHHRYYNPSFEEIVTNPVPFDANVGAAGALSGGGKLGHRTMTLGHDPILGLVFGTANIATSTLTTATLESYHIKTGLVAGKRVQDVFGNHADTQLVFKHTIDKMINQGIEGKMKVAASLVREIDHLRSDVNSKNSLPLPIVSVINPGFASELASYGLDMANVITVGKQASYAIFINSLIAMVHRLFFDGTTEMDKKLYEVRTRKILSYSNLVASSSNVAVVALTSDFSKLDVGGIAVAIYRLITDAKFIRQVKEEFIFGSYKDMIMGEDI